MKGQRKNVSGLCKHAGMTRQNYYTKRKRRQNMAINEEFILNLVRRERCVQPRLGTRKLLVLIKDELTDNNAAVGRDRLFDLLRPNNLLLERKKAFIPKTTNSRHSLPVFHNLIAGNKATAPNQIWVSDLTYIRTEEGFIYGALNTDAYSRKIVGAHAGDSLESEGCIVALNKALQELSRDCFPIHHSDRGCQYCCHAYVDILRDRGLPISMTEANHCYENAKAERVNGILKQEYGLDYTFQTKEQAVVAFYEAVYLYNNRRPHMSLNYRIPAQVHCGVAA
jgi:transposase InsO family protein